MGDIAVIRCRVWRGLDDRTAIVRIPGYPHLLRLLVNAIAEVSKGPGCCQAQLETGDSIMLRCPIKHHHGDGSVTVHMPGYGVLALDGLADTIEIEHTSRRKVVWLTRPPAI